MVNIIQFTPRKDLSAQRNLEAFIAIARDHIPTWGELAGFRWDRARWPTKSGNAIRFTNEENVGLHPSKSPSPQQLLHPAFINVAKAYLRHRYHLTPNRSPGPDMQALRALEYVLRKDMDIPDITKVSQRHFDQAITIINRHKDPGQVAVRLLAILKRLADFAIVSPEAHLWSHPFVGPLSPHSTNGAKAPQEVKDKKIPNQDALLAIGEVFGRGYHEKLEDVDVMVTSITALLLSAPMRLMETVRFRTDFLADDTDKEGITQNYFKYWVPKIGEFSRKPIPKTMAEIAIEAARRLTEITNEARRLARYMETNPVKFYRHPKCPNVPNDQILTAKQIMQALGFASPASTTNYLKKRTGSFKISGYTLDSLWKIVLEDHIESNPHFPYQTPVDGAPPLKMSESLLCCLRYQFSTDWATSPILLAPFNHNYFQTRLSATKKINGRSAGYCFYSRHGFEAIRIKSHSLRHFLNRLAKQSGISIDVITAWSSRSSNNQTATYLDNDEGQAATAAAALLGHDLEHSSMPPVTNEEAEIYGHGPIHRSRYGLCRRSWRTGPCNKFADCLNCSEILICKGDRFATDVIASERDTLAKTYHTAKQAIINGERSSTRWMKVSERQVKKMDELLMILNNPNIPDGSPIGINGTDFSHEHTLIKERAEEANVTLLDRNSLAIEYGNDLLACLDELRK